MVKKKYNNYNKCVYVCMYIINYNIVIENLKHIFKFLYV